MVSVFLCWSSFGVHLGKRRATSSGKVQLHVQEFIFNFRYNLTTFFLLHYLDAFLAHLFIPGITTHVTGYGFLYTFDISSSF